MGTVTPELIRTEGMAARDVELDPQRCAELAQELNRLNGAVREMRPRLDFNTEPARFDAVLVASAHARSDRT